MKQFASGLNIDNSQLWFRAGNKRLNINALALLLVICTQALTLFIGGYGFLLVRGIQLAVYIVILIRICLSRELKYLLIAFGAIAMLIGINYLLYPANRPALIEVSTDMLLQSLYFIIGYTSREDKDVFNVLRVGAVLFLAYMVLGIFVIGGLDFSRDYNLISNGLFWIVLFYLVVKKEYVRYKIPLLVFSTLLLFMYGRRAHILYLGIIVVLLMLRNWHNQKSTRKLISIVAVSALIVALIISYRYILIFMNGFLQNLGIYSRTITMLVQGNVSDLNGRHPLYEIAWRLAKESPLVGNGIGSTMVEGVRIAYKQSTYAACNTHNSILEISAEYGFPVVIVFCILFFNVFKNIVIWPMKDSEMVLMYILAGTGFTASLIGGGYLNSSNYALAVGYYFYLHQIYSAERTKLKFRVRKM